MTPFRRSQWTLWLTTWLSIAALLGMAITMHVVLKPLITEHVSESTFQAIAQGSIFGFVLLAGLARHLLRRRLERTMEAQQFRVCFACEHTLAGLPNAGACPECGQLYDESLPRLWINRMRKPLRMSDLPPRLRILNIAAWCIIFIALIFIVRIVFKLFSIAIANA